MTSLCGPGLSTRHIEAGGSGGESEHVAVSCCWYLIIRVHQINDILHSLEIESPCYCVDSWRVQFLLLLDSLLSAWAINVFLVATERRERWPFDEDKTWNEANFLSKTVYPNQVVSALLSLTLCPQPHQLFCLVRFVKTLTWKILKSPAKDL